MKLKVTYLVVLIVTAISGFSQSNALIWYFGKHAGIDFNVDPPEALIDGAIDQKEGCATLCDSDGKILLYTDGRSIYNKSHSIVENGSGLTGHPSSTQSGLIVPVPNDPTTVYVFSVDAELSNEGVCYSIVDMTANEGLGKVVEKNTPLLSPSEEKITAVHHSNGTDIWLLSHTWNSNNFYAFLITEEGIQTTPVVSSVGPIHQGPDVHGSMKVSSTGDRLAIVTRFTNSFYLYNFNNETGEISEPIEFPNLGYCYGLEFSPDGSKLYVTKYNEGTYLYQYDLSSENPDEIFNSRYTVATFSTTYAGAVQLAPDGKIYITRFSSLNSGSQYLSVLQNPNESGSSCGFSLNGFNLNTGRAVWGLPNFIQSAIISECRNDFDFEGFCLNEPCLFFSDHPGSIPDSVRWNFGDPETGQHNTSTLLNPQHIFSVPGEYIVSLTSFMNAKSCTTEKTITIYDIPEFNLPDTAAICDNESINIQIPEEYSCFWSDESDENFRTFSEGGKYWVDVENSFGCTLADTMVIMESPSPQFSLGNDTIICKDDYLTLFISGFNNYLWQDGSTEPVFIARESGIYWLEIYNQYGCSNRDSLYLTTSQPSLLLPPDTMICDNDSILLIAGTSIFDYEWFDGSTDTCMWAYIQGAYSVTATDSLGCTATEETNINHISSPVVDLGRDTGFCDYDTFTFSLDEPYTTYIWNGNDTSQVFIPSSGGEFFVTATNRCGESSDTILLEKYFSPEVYLGPDTVLFPGQELFLDAGPGYLSYLWSTGNTESSIYISEPANYYVTIWNEHCKATDTIQIKRVSPFRVPNVFTPNNDGYNDDFEILGEYIDKFYLVILNRWGETLYETNDINLRWDGTFHGRQCAEGVYFWIIRYQYPTEKTPTTIQGTVTIVTD